MKKTPRKVLFGIAKAVVMLCALLSGVNILLISTGSRLIMPISLSTTGYLAKAGIRLSAESGNGFFAVYCAVLAGIVCAVLLACAALAGRPGWLAAAVIIFLADCAGIALLILDQGYRSGYWFELAGHAVILAALAVMCLAFPRKKSVEDGDAQPQNEAGESTSF